MCFGSGLLAELQCGIHCRLRGYKNLSFLRSLLPLSWGTKGRRNWVTNLAVTMKISAAVFQVIQQTL